MKTEWKIFWVFLIFTALMTKPYSYGDNEGSRFNALNAIVEEHSLGWSKPLYFTNDRIRVNGNDYSDKPYGLVLLTFPVYIILYLLGISFSANVGLSTYSLKVLIVGVATSYLLVLFYRSLKEIEKKERILLTLMLGFATLLLTYATAYNSHSIVALLLFAVFTFYLKKEVEYKSLFTIGALLGLTTSIDPVFGAFFTTSIFFYYFFFTKLDTKSKGVLILGFFCTFSLFMVSNFMIVGNPFIPANSYSEYYVAAETGWTRETLPGFFHHGSVKDFMVYSFHSTIGYRGLFSYTPILLFGFIILLMRTFRERSLALLSTLFPIVGIIAFYCVYTFNYGGSSYGSRYFVALTPILLYYCKDIFTKYQKFKTLFYMCAIFSCVVALIGAFNPWVNHLEHGLGAISFFRNLDLVIPYNTAGHYILRFFLPWWF